MTVQRRTRTIAQAPELAVTEPGAATSTRLEVGPEARTVVLPYASDILDHMGVGELLSAAEVLNTDLDGLMPLMRSRGVARARFLIAIAWVLMRRIEPAVTWDEAQRWRLEVEVGDPKSGGSPPNGGPVG